ERLLAEQQWRQSTTEKYLHLAIDPSRPETYRLMILRFLTRSTTEPTLQVWAQEELAIVQGNIKTLQEQIAKKEELLASKETELEEARQRVTALRQSSNAPAEQVQVVQESINKAQRDIAKVQAEKQAVRLRLDGPL